MVKTESLEGVVDEVVWFHFDVADDVLYLRIASRRDEPTYAEETDEGLLALHSERDDSVIGITVVDFWKRFGTKDVPTAAIPDVEDRISKMAGRLAA